MSELDLETIALMEKRGGSFVKALANAARYADPPNLETIKLAFPVYWQKYATDAAWELQKLRGEATA
jgi:hypothetical protein